MKALIKSLRDDLYSKPAPGKILNDITEIKLKKLSKKYEHNYDALWLGSCLADLFITEAKDTGDIKKHVPMALDYAANLIRENDISDQEAEIILEVIETHHGGEQKHIESKLYKNADCFKFLDPKGVFHIFAVFYDKSESGFKKAIQYAMYKVDEKYNLVDIDEETKKEAKQLYDHWLWIFKQMPYTLKTPELYK